MAGSSLSACDKLMAAASTGNTELVVQLLASSSASVLEPDEVTHKFLIAFPVHTHGGLLIMSPLP